MSSILHGSIRWCSKSLVAPKSLGGISPCAYEFWLPLLHTQALHSFAVIGRKMSLTGADQRLEKQNCWPLFLMLVFKTYNKPGH